MTAYYCSPCRVTYNRWAARCPRCDAFLSVVAAPARAPFPAAAVVAAAPPPETSVRASRPVASTPIPITDVDAALEERLFTQIEPLDRVLGGGLVLGSVVLIGGEPGLGKSTLLAQMLAALPCERLLYATGEESTAQVAMRARRVDAARARIQIVAETDVDAVVAHAEALRPGVLAVDSIQTMTTGDVASLPGSVAQVRECTARLTAFAKQTDTPIVLIGHVTKDGAVAGPKTLTHLVDAVLMFERADDGVTLQLRASKNRFGSTQEVGCFAMAADGLHPADANDERASRANPLLPVTRELIERYLEIGGQIDPGLEARLAGLVDVDPRRTPFGAPA